MQRRTLLKLGLGATVVLAIAGVSAALIRPGLAQGRLTPAGRDVLVAIGRAVLDGSLPLAANERDRAIRSHLARLDEAILVFPPAVQQELSQLLAVLASAPGRVALAGLHNDWADASVPQLQTMLQWLRTSSLTMRQQTYHALRDLTNAAFFADPEAWAQMGYPGPRAM